MKLWSFCAQGLDMRSVLPRASPGGLRGVLPSVLRGVAMGMVLGAALALAGCAAVPSERFYTLQPEAVALTPLATRPELRIVVAGARIADLVDRPQLVIRKGPTEVQVLEQQRWAEPLRAGIARVVAAHLARLLGTPRVSVDGDGDVRVGIEVQRFESTPGQGVRLDALWTVSGPGLAGRGGRVDVEEPAAGPGMPAVVDAHSRALATLSRAIAQAIAAP